MRTRDERREAVCGRVAYWARRLNVRPRRIRIQAMTRKWGSCSTSGTVTFAADLAGQDPEFRDFVIVHELLHLRVPNHGRLFKALMTAHLPGWKKHDTRLGHRPARTVSAAQPPDSGKPGAASRS